MGSGTASGGHATGVTGRGPPATGQRVTTVRSEAEKRKPGTALFLLPFPHPFPILAPLPPSSCYPRTVLYVPLLTGTRPQPLAPTRSFGRTAVPTPTCCPARPLCSHQLRPRSSQLSLVCRTIRASGTPASLLPPGLSCSAASEIALKRGSCYFLPKPSGLLDSLERKGKFLLAEGGLPDLAVSRGRCSGPPRLPGCPPVSPTGHSGLSRASRRASPTHHTPRTKGTTCKGRLRV